MTGAGVTVGGLWALWTLRPRLVRVQGSSMEPTLQPGALLLVARRPRPCRGDLVVVLHPDGFEMVKRVEAAPGDEAMPGWVLGRDEWLVLGDNREGSEDSRRFGAVPDRAILGRVLLPRNLRHAGR